MLKEVVKKVWSIVAAVLRVDDVVNFLKIWRRKGLDLGIRVGVDTAS